MIAIADDLTGAADCAAASAGRGIGATVLLHSPELHAPGPDWPQSEILSIDANTRALPAAQAAAVAADVVRICQAQGGLGAGSFLFKKLDSTLRGNWAAELAAMLQAYGSLAPEGKRPRALLAPALPGQGRTTVHGRQKVHGRPLEQTDFWERQGGEASLAPMLAEVGLSCRGIDLEKVRAGVGSLRQAMAKLMQEAEVLVCDAETDDDLRRIAEASAGLEERVVWAGSAGLAWHLPHAVGLAGAGTEAGDAHLSFGPTLFVVGTLAAAAREQAAVLAGEPGVVTVRVRPSELLKSQTESLAVVEGLRSGHDVLVWLEETKRCAADEATRLPGALAKAIARCAGLAGGLVATGGETARAILDEMGIRRLRVLGEVEPGLPFSVSDGWTRPLPVLTKAGGFGSAETLVHCREFLRKRERGSARADAQRAPIILKKREG